MEFTPTSKKGSTLVVFTEGALNKFVEKGGATELHVGLGPTKPLSRRKFILTLRKVVSVAKQNKLSALTVKWEDIRALTLKDMGEFEAGQIACTAFDMADYEHTTYKTKPKEGFAHVEVIALPGVSKEGIAGCKKGHWIAKEVNAARELANTPGGDMTPKALAAAARAAVKGTSATVKVLGRAEMTKLKMGAVLGVARGSAHEPQFIIVEYKGAKASQKPVVLVGKGVTFDTGGLQIKGDDHMYEMHMDMSGGASVIHAVALAAKLKLRANVVGLVPAVENGVTGDAMRPGDILKSLSGKTIEILHTDAEGRVILADAITYAKRFNPAVVADVATLTGASLTALGEVASAFMTNEKEVSIADYMALAEESGDYMWPMPMWEEYDEMTKGKFGDVPNISTMGNSRYGGVIAGGKFLEVFAKELGCPWIHIDMAPKMTSASYEFLAKGAAGSPVRFLLALIEKYAH